MAAEWFYQVGGQQSGPVDSGELRRLAEAGIVSPGTWVRQTTSSCWVYAEQVRGLFQQSTSAPSSSLGASSPPPPPRSSVPESDGLDIDFDPYHVWLGIHPAKRPLNHYILLGIPEHEGDPRVIANAADRQMAHLRTYQAGKHVEACQKLLNELARARVCLLDPTKKAAYDRALQQAQAAMPPPVVRLSTSQVRQEAELARRRRADRERERTGSPPVREPAAVSGVQSGTLTEFGRYVLAMVACGAILLLYVIACGVFEWKRGGGAIPMLMFLGAMTAAWKAITGDRRRRKGHILESPSRDAPQVHPPPQPVGAAPAVASEPATKKAAEATPCAPSASLEASLPAPPPPRSSIPGSGELSKGVVGESAIRHGLRAAAVNEESDEPERPSAPRPLMWHAGCLFARARAACTEHYGNLALAASMVAIAGTVILIAVLFGGDSAPQPVSQEAADQAQAYPVPLSGEFSYVMSAANRPRSPAVAVINLHVRGVDGGDLPDWILAEYTVGAWVQEQHDVRVARYLDFADLAANNGGELLDGVTKVLVQFRFVLKPSPPSSEPGEVWATSYCWAEIPIEPALRYDIRFVLSAEAVDILRHLATESD